MTTTRGTLARRLGVAGCALVLGLLAGIPVAHGQKSTEQFIPIGQSPGVSGKVTSLGTITDANARLRTITVADARGPRTIQLTDTTRIWLDRTKLRRSNISGSFLDLVKGRRVEAKYQLPATGHVAEWVKVEVAR